MSRSREGAARPPSANIAAGSSRSAARPGDSGFDAQVALALVGLGVVGHVLRSRRFYEKVAVAAIVLGALRGIGHDNRVSTLARLQAWDKREVQRLERKAKRRSRASSARLSGRSSAWSASPGMIIFVFVSMFGHKPEARQCARRERDRSLISLGGRGPRRRGPAIRGLAQQPTRSGARRRCCHCCCQQLACRERPRPRGTRRSAGSPAEDPEDAG